jgi:cephalosporin hydroxylase
VRFDTVESLLDFVLGPRALFIRPTQIREEIEPLLQIVAARRPRTILEIGTNNGGTLFLWTRVAAEDATIISLDLPGGDFGGGYPAWKRPLYRAFALPNQRVHLVQGDSHHPTSLATIREMFGGRELDVLLIDGDHTYDGVKMDFEMYAPLVRQGGLVAFHDIAEHDDESCRVRSFWLEIRGAHAGREFIASPPAGWAGIGVLESLNQASVARPAAPR